MYHIYKQQKYLLMIQGETIHVHIVIIFCSRTSHWNVIRPEKIAVFMLPNQPHFTVPTLKFLKYPNYKNSHLFSSFGHLIEQANDFVCL